MVVVVVVVGPLTKTLDIPRNEHLTFFWANFGLVLNQRMPKIFYTRISHKKCSRMTQKWPKYSDEIYVCTIAHAHETYAQCRCSCDLD